MPGGSINLLGHGQWSGEISGKRIDVIPYSESEVCRQERKSYRPNMGIFSGYRGSLCVKNVQI